ncbi:MAG: hypothetical protein AB8B85_09485 [Paracoccaceae bacterium]
MAVRRRPVLGWLIASLVLLSGVAVAEDHLLVVRNPAVGGDRGEIRFNRADLEAMEWRTIETGNQFISGKSVFRGPLVMDAVSLIGHAGATKVRLIAANEYFSEIEIAEIQRYGAILAMEMNGDALSLRDFGPIWVMYPIDDHSELRDSVFNNRLIWQLEAIELF